MILRCYQDAIREITEIDAGTHQWWFCTGIAYPQDIAIIYPEAAQTARVGRSIQEEEDGAASRRA